MKNLIIFIAVVMCMGMGSKQPVPVPKPIETVEPFPTFPVEPSEKKMLHISKCSNCTVKEYEFIKRAELKMNDVVKTSCFLQGLSQMPLIQTEGKTPVEVAFSLPHAGIDIEVEMYYTSKRVLGYTLPTAQKEWLNRRYMLEWNVCDLGSLLAHETSHKIGYDHDHKATKRRPNSVPYSINRAFKACCQK